MISISVARTALSLPPLVADTPGVAWVPEDGLGDPGYRYRIERPPNIPGVHGSEKYSVDLDMGELPVSIYLMGSSSADLANTKAAWVAAFGQWSYEMTVTVDGVATTYLCDPVYPRWGGFDSGMVRAHLARGDFSVPVQPLEVSA